MALTSCWCLVILMGLEVAWPSHHAGLRGNAGMWRKAWTPGSDMSVSPELSIYKIGNSPSSSVVRKSVSPEVSWQSQKERGG